MREHVKPSGRLPVVARAAIWTVKVTIALFFAYAATKKLMGAESSVSFFQNIGLGQWFRYFTGVFEITASILVLIPALSIFGSLLMVCVSVGALATLLFLGLNPLPALVTLAVSAVLAYSDRHSPILWKMAT